ncbi:MAG: hypothetical protein M1840_006123 [Geoglossum simile]|nr:MAG: hypothetical protein M1840_006123 [Geoglossum simile]
MLPALALLATLLPLALAQYGDSGSSPTSTKSSSPAVSSGDPGVHIVEVGNGGTKFTPDTLNVIVGEHVEFRFSPQNHSVVQSSFEEPCVPKDQGVFSGFQPVQSGVGTQGWTLRINDTSSIWLYCSQGKHCQNGMSMVINPIPNKNNIAAYKLASANTTSSSPAIIQGGRLGPLSGSSPSSSSSSSASTPTGAGVRGVALGDAGRFILAIGVLAAASML